MRIIRFAGSGIHGFLDRDISFKPDITFLTGINGSGKTTVVNLIVAMLTPALDILANIEFKNVRILIESDRKRHSIRVDKYEKSISINENNSGESFTYTKFPLVSESATPKELEMEQEYYKEILITNTNNPVIDLIANLPTPMFLGVDRRTRISGELSRFMALRSASKPSRNYFNSPLLRSLSDAAGLVETKYRDRLISVGRLGDELRKKILLELLRVDPVAPFRDTKVPTASDVREIHSMRRDVQVLPSVLGLAESEVQNRINPFLDQLESYAKSIPHDYNPQRKLESKKDVDTYIALASWQTNRHQLDKIKSVSNLLQKFDNDRKYITDETDRYFSMVNKFLIDSGKTLKADDVGYISCSISNIEEDRPLTALSSGEAQIFVILSHLFFNPIAQKGNIFIVDEPELSLHVQWQELFVDSIMNANSNVQYILATHSPSIILDKVEKCVDISPKGSI